MLAVIAAAVAPSAEAAPSCAPVGANIVCTYSTVGTDTFTVPGGVTSLTVDTYGAQGGSDPGVSAGGLGGHANATLAVTTGQILQVNVGGAGGAVGSSVPNGGFNGGGTAGSAPNPGAGGGGASDVRQAPFGLADRLLIGGGGGGSGNANGGAGGGLTGGADSDVNSGKGGTQIDGGAGGA
jgi:hypothetical protein